MHENFDFGLSHLLGCRSNSVNPLLYLSSVAINFIFVSWFTMTDLLPKLKNATNRRLAPLSLCDTSSNDPLNQDTQEETLEETLEETSTASASTALDANSWNCVGASVIGTSHVRKSSPCQDYHAYAYLPDDSLCVAVADGAGSVTHSDIGAKIACETLIEYWSGSLTRDTGSEPINYREHIEAGFEQAHQKIIEVAEEKGQEAKDFATTLIGLIITPTSIIAGMVGDGMVILQSQEEYRCLFQLPEREYANQMHSITSKRYRDNFQVLEDLSSISSVAICTDGILSLSCDLSNNTPYAPFFENVFQVFEVADDTSQPTEILEDYLQHPLINEMTEDDKTLVMAKRILARQTNIHEQAAENTY